MKEDARTHFRATLAARIEAFKAIRGGEGRTTPDSLDSARRLARTLHSSAKEAGFTEIEKAASIIEEATQENLGERLDALLACLRRAAEAGEPGAETTILIVDDDPMVTLLLTQALAAPGRRVRIATNLAEGGEILAREKISLLILDIVLPDSDGRNLLARLRERPETAALPILILSGTQSAQAKTECFTLGADGYFEKPIDPAIFVSAATSLLARAAETAREARRDALTNLPNRAAFHEAFGHAAALAARSAAPLAIAILDLDRFKSVNDTHGHATGDEVLRRSAHVISLTLRKSDLIARWGGEEFVVLFPDATPEGATRGLEKALAALREEGFEAPAGGTFHVSFSAGCADVTPGMPIEEAVAEADRYLYQAKAAGRNRIVSSKTAPPSHATRILLAEDDPLVTAVVRHRLEREGYEVLTFVDGTAAWEAAPHADAALIILDIQMPGIDGFELLSRLRKNTSTATTPILLLTALGNDADIARGFETGADDYIPKPFSPLELLARVRRLLKKRA